jgi:hypothetical protein
LLETFWTGSHGWTDQQLPDGTIHASEQAARIQRERQRNQAVIDNNRHHSDPTLALPSTPATSFAGAEYTSAIPVLQPCRQRVCDDIR